LPKQKQFRHVSFQKSKKEKSLILNIKKSMTHQASILKNDKKEKYKSKHDNIETQTH